LAITAGRQARKAIPQRIKGNAEELPAETVAHEAERPNPAHPGTVATGAIGSSTNRK
jgi:hypothetical protein